MGIPLRPGRVGESTRQEHGKEHGGSKQWYCFTMSFVRRECLNSHKYLAYRKKIERLGRVLGTKGMNFSLISNRVLNFQF